MATYSYNLRNDTIYSYPLADASGSLLKQIWYDVTRDALVTSGILEGQASNFMNGLTGEWSITGAKVINAALTKEFRLLANGNLEARSFIVE